MYGIKSKERRDLFRCLWSEWRHAGSVPDMMVHQSSVLCSWLLIFIQPWGLWAEMCMLLGQICLFTFFSSMHEGCTPFRLSPCGFIFTCWGCCGLCQRHKPTDLAHSFSYSVPLSISVRFFFVLFFYGAFDCISFCKFSRQLSAFSLCSPGLNSALLVLSTIHLFMKVSLSPDVILCGWLGLKHQLTN